MPLSIESNLFLHKCNEDNWENKVVGAWIYFGNNPAKNRWAWFAYTSLIDSNKFKF